LIDVAFNTCVQKHAYSEKWFLIFQTVVDGTFVERQVGMTNGGIEEGEMQSERVGEDWENHK